MDDELLAIAHAAWRGTWDPSPIEGEYARTVLQIVEDLRADYNHLMGQVLQPPPGWSVFGDHSNDNPVPDLEFWGNDGAGLPLWERIKPTAVYVYRGGRWVRLLAEDVVSTENERSS